MSELPDDFPEWLTAERHAHYTRPPTLAYQLSRAYPNIDTESELYRAAHRDIVRQHEAGTTPEQIFSNFLSMVRDAGGVLPVALVNRPGGDRLVADPGGDTLLEFGLDDDDFMEFRELSRNDFDDMTREELIDLLVSLQDAVE
ncbi:MULTISPECIES: hypothetical protein [Halomicrobium]|uniref:Uncharacterized protein n=2 Tax=Halomicrobium mukohataei TaxID=57705 RepID=C7P4K6_HALMD|nr:MULTISPECIES: hypothetical protein [Halomicrobium]ACV48028.1 hypothetical protein Hmuk_1915 [Halomicrobium mukohataei DSM 12286]QCD66461.1 hypothetical protein E5139_12690 [Halomicrobium mukohataei]QFR21267.1 hypothetical protein GBQ70_12705 [Halomicrobium sp. ZPS1]